MATEGTQSDPKPARRRDPGSPATGDKVQAPVPALSPGTLTINDPYNGPIRLIWQGKFICGSGGQTPAASEGITALAQNLSQQ